jgi:hypothetical protein
MKNSFTTAIRIDVYPYVGQLARHTISWLPHLPPFLHCAGPQPGFGEEGACASTKRRLHQRQWSMGGTPRQAARLGAAWYSFLRFIFNCEVLCVDRD